MFTAGLHHYELLKIWKLSAIKETTIHFHLSISYSEIGTSSLLSDITLQAVPDYFILCASFSTHNSTNIELHQGHLLGASKKRLPRISSAFLRTLHI